MNHPPRCRACGSSNVTLRGRKRGTYIPQEFSFYRCDECRFLGVEPFSGFEIYDDKYYRGEGPDPYVNYESEYRDWKVTERRYEFEDLVRIADQHLRTMHAAPTAGPVRWLDFGCGAGGLLKFLREQGQVAGRPVELTGHDVGTYADLLRERDGFRILSLEDLGPEPSEAYDVITLIEVIEHLPNPRDVIAQVARLLRPGGLLLLTTGNLQAPIPRRAGIRHHYCVPEIHVSLFNPRALERLYADTGLEPKQVRYRGAVKFKVLKTVRHSPLLHGLAKLALNVPPILSLIDAAYGVSAMPCAVKPATPPPPR